MFSTLVNVLKKMMVGLLIMFGLIIVGIMYMINKGEEYSPVLGEVPEFSFTERLGTEFGLDDLKGKISVVDFIFTECQTACPIMSGEMVRLYNYYSDNDKVQFVSISVDPEYDTLEVLQEYANLFGVNDKRWVFLRAEIEEVVKLSEKGFMLAADDLPGNHSTKFVLVDAEGQIRGYFESEFELSMELLKEKIALLLADESS